MYRNGTYCRAKLSRTSRCRIHGFDTKLSRIRPVIVSAKQIRSNPKYTITFCADTNNYNLFVIKELCTNCGKNLLATLHVCKRPPTSTIKKRYRAADEEDAINGLVMLKRTAAAGR